MARCFLTLCTIIQVTLYPGSLAVGNEGIKTLSFCNAANNLQVKTQQPFAYRKTWVIMNPSFRNFFFQVLERQEISTPSKTCNHMSEFPLITVPNTKGFLSW